MIDGDSSIVYITAVDLNYPDDLHELYNGYPLVPERLEISQNMLSKNCCNISDEYGIKIGKVSILVLNLGNKSKYVLHYKNLKLYLSMNEFD